MRESFYDIQAVERESVAQPAAPAPAAAAARPLPAVPLVDEDDIPLDLGPGPRAAAHLHDEGHGPAPGGPCGPGRAPGAGRAAYEEPVRRVAGA